MNIGDRVCAHEISDDSPGLFHDEIGVITGEGNPGFDFAVKLDGWNGEYSFHASELMLIEEVSICE